MRIIPVLAFSLFASALALAADPSASKLPRSTPEEQGVSSAGVLRFIEESTQKLDELHSFMLVRHGHVVAEGWWSPYAANEQHVLFSLSKSFTSTAVGLAVAEGRLSIDDPVLKFFPDEAPAQPSKNLQAMRVRDLLTMSTGQHDEDIQNFPFNTADAVKTFLSLPVAHKPGTHFVYNTPGTFMQSAIVQKVTGQSVLEYLRPRLFEPLGIANPWWEANPKGISMGGFGLNVTTEDIAKFGQLYLQKGQWQGKQLVPAEWIQQATSKQVSNGSDPTSDWEQGYGFQFWRCKHGFYRGDGAFGQYCIVLEKYDAVIAITSGTKNMGAVMNLVWDVIVPALAADHPLAPDAATHQKLVAKLASLSLPTVAGKATSPLAKTVAGRRYVFPTNPSGIESITMNSETAGAPLTFAVRIGGVDQTLAVGNAAWVKGELKTAMGTQAVAASGGWTADHIYTLKLVQYRTPFNTTYTLRFAGDELLLDYEQNVGFGELKAPQLIGKAQ
jgi:CubicO group peptidase (beta-lactamase class C family)